MDFSFTEEQRMLRDGVTRVMNELATPEYIRECDREQRFPEELYKAWVDLGLLRLPFPEEYGGMGGNVIDLAVMAEAISYKSFDFFTALGASLFCGLNLLAKGTTEQKAQLLPKLLAGEVKFSVSISEPEAGSDVGAMRSTAVRDGTDWLINGQKLWATSAGAPDNIIHMYVKTDPKAHYRKGMSLFLVDNRSEGLELRKLDMLGRRCTGTYEIHCNDVRVAADRLVGGENNGWQVVMAGLQVERVTVTAGYIGGMQAILDDALQYAKDRKQFGRPIGTNQAIAHMLADMQADLEVSRTMMWRAAWTLASGADALKEISIAKLFASEAYVRMANNAMQILGAYGYCMEFDMQRHFRDARSVTIGAGTSQMQRNLIAARMGLKVDNN
ncbi:acyl-CoA dehydrogenase family protein [Diaphorobacter caeni]|uniref:acyl-CoA dehydrogenase family protein n=1 Tax=Diaphorobacter caeni TaxID=2784387 RepID=UPI0018906491|nr:acyl-CoA dehydrogenase family protein [Diaphorobacter caeni]MBF5007730.1 acyl-CoA/acyl-ACP dehydrogenase [Diaphorobacter caeni]